MDLVTTAVSNPASAAPGASFSVSDTVKNQGGATAVASTTRYYLSLDNAKSSGDVLLVGSRSVPSLAAGQTSSGNATVTIPSTTPLGTYYLLSCADDPGTVTESDNTNNCRASSGTVTVK